MAQAPTEKKLTCTIVTPERALLERKADFVALPLYDGEIGFLPGRSPIVGRLGSGELRIRENNEIVRYFVDEGFVQVRDNVVTVLTSRAQLATDINVAETQEKLEDATKQKPQTEEGLEEREKDIARARAKIRVAERAKA